MADKYATPVIEGGVYTPPLQGDLTGRRDPILGTIRDTVLETAASAIDVLATPYAAGRDYGAATGNKKYEVAGQLGQQVASQTKDWIRSGKTDFGRQEDLNGGENATWLSSAAEALPPAIPAIATAMLAGPWAGPAVYGGLAHGQQSQQFEEQLYKMPREQLEQLESYKKHKAEGLSHDDIMRAIHADMRNNPAAYVPNVLANTFFGGVASHLVGKIGSRSVAQTMKDRIIQRVLPDIGEAIGGGYATGFAQSAGRQSGEITAGIRDDYSLSEMHAAGTDIASVVAPLGIASGATGLRGPKTPASAVTPGSLIDDANKRPTPAIGSELKVVATDNLKDNPIGTETTAPAPKPGEAAPVTPPAAGVTPAGDPRAALQGTGETGDVRMRDVDIGQQNGAPPAPTGATGPAQHVGTRPDGSHEWQWPGAAGATHYATVGVDGQVLSRGQASTPGEAVTPVDPAVAAGVTTPEGSLGRDIKAVQEELQNLTHQRQSLDAASPDQKASLEWREESQRIDQELARVNQEAAAPSPIPGAAAPPAAAAHTLPSPTVAAGVEPVVAAAPKMTLDELKARAVDPAQTPTYGDLMKHIAEWKRDNPGQKLSNLNEITNAWSSAHGQAQANIKKQAKEQRATEAAEKRAAKEQAGLAKKQAKGYAGLAREQAQAVKAKGKKAKAEVTQEGKAPADVTPAKTPEPKEGAAPAETRAGGEAKEAAPVADEPVNTATLRAKLGLKPAGEGVTHGEAAAPAIAKLTEERQQKAAQAWDPVSKRQTKEAKDKARAEAKGASREDQVTQRETTAKDTLEHHKPGANYAAELDSVGAAVKEGKADSPTVKGHVAQVVADVREMVADYKDRLSNLRGGTEAHPVFALGRGVEGKSRAGKGEHHSFFSEMNNFLIAVDKALKKGDDTRAKELTLRYLDHSRLVREGEIKEVTTSRQKVADEVGSQKKASQLSDEQTARAEAKVKTDDAAVKRLEDEVEANLAKKPVKQLTDDELRARGMAVPKRNAKGEVIGWHREEVPGQPHSEYVNGVAHVADPHRVNTFRRALTELKTSLGRALTMDEVLRVGERLGHEVRRSTFGELMAPHRPDNPIMAVVFDAVHAMVKDMPAHVVSVDMLEAIVPNARAGYNPHLGAGLYRPDTLVDRTVFHEALHAATARALHGSERLEHLVRTLQNNIEKRYKNSPAGKASLPYQMAINRNDKRVTTHEFISELFTRPEVRDMLEKLTLREGELAQLRSAGYDVGRGQTLLGALWRGFLDAIGFKADRPNMMKVAVDMLQDVFDREMDLRARDTALGRPDIGRIFSNTEIKLLAKEDPVLYPHMRKAQQAAEAGNHAEAAQILMDQADRMDEKTADASIKYLHGVNEGYWGDDVLPEAVTPLSSPDTIRNEVSTFLDERFGSTAKDWAWQFDNKFGTPVRKFLSGLTYTNDIGEYTRDGVPERA